MSNPPHQLLSLLVLVGSIQAALRAQEAPPKPDLTVASIESRLAAVDKSPADGASKSAARGLLHPILRREVQHDLHDLIHARFAQEALEIAFPQLDLHLRSTLPPGGIGPTSPPGNSTTN